MSAFELFRLLLLAVVPLVLIASCLGLFFSLGKRYKAFMSKKEKEKENGSDKIEP